MARTTIGGGGAFTSGNISDLNANFTELYAGISGGTFASPTITGTVAGSATYTTPTLTTPVVATGLTASGSAANDFSASTGTFLTSTGANTLSGAVSIADATTPSLTTATGKTNTGFVTVLGKTSGGLKVTAADATAQTVTVTTAAQTVGAATITIKDQASVASNLATIVTAGAWKIASGITALDGSNPTPVTTGLATIVGLSLALNRSTAVSSGTAFVTYGTITAGAFDMYGWLVAGGASTGTENVAWCAIGT
jgi:hypothetical protein